MDPSGILNLPINFADEVLSIIHKAIKIKNATSEGCVALLFLVDPSGIEPLTFLLLANCYQILKQYRGI